MACVIAVTSDRVPAYVAGHDARIMVWPISFTGSSDCSIEPRCNGAGPCMSKRGDGLVIGEECDDGNNVDGDGCSSSCKIESGFTCTQPPITEPVLISAVYRDFHSLKTSDFETRHYKDLHAAFALYPVAGLP